MATTCLNCDTALTGKYCSHCGQKASVGRLTWHYLLEETLHFFTHIEHGFLKTTKDLIIQPSAVQKNYLDGKRKNYHKPISFLLIWVAIFLLVSELSSRFGSFDREFSATFLTISPTIEAMISKYRSLIEILILPFTAFNAWLLLAYPRITYLEVLVTGFYRFAVFYMFLTVQYLIGLIFGINPQSEFSLYAMAIIFSAWTFYVFHDLFKQYHVKSLVVRVIATILIGVVIYSFLRVIIAKLFLAWGF
jgi:hypothetical protein